MDPALNSDKSSETRNSNSLETEVCALASMAPTAGLTSNPSAPISPRCKLDSRYSSSPPKEPSPPSLEFDPKRLPKLVDRYLVEFRILLWSDPRLELDCNAFRDKVPPWSLSLESYYDAFHPHTWVALGFAYEALLAYLSRLEDWLSRRKSDGVDEQELGQYDYKLDEARTNVFTIYELYGLHYLRQLYLKRYRSADIFWNDSKIIHETLEFESDGWICICVYRQHSLWPLPLPITTIPGDPDLICRTVIPIAELSEAEQARYAIPTLDPIWTLRFSPMPVLDFRRRCEDAEEIHAMRAAALREEAKDVELAAREAAGVAKSSAYGEETREVAVPGDRPASSGRDLQVGRSGVKKRTRTLGGPVGLGR